MISLCQHKTKGENKTAVKTDYKVGDKVVFISENEHKEFPSYYPEVGTVGTVLGRDANTWAYVKWEKARHQLMTNGFASLIG